MDEPHSGLSHDLPAYYPNDPPQIPWRRVQVFKGPLSERWRWVHECATHKGACTEGYDSHLLALVGALEHARLCVRASVVMELRERGVL
ncbi:hypothetical protein ACGF5F_29730 [Streptomyces sp. NPDC047821]|uniref:hypothetical protein n=1 Tax=Streptomyces sp. NPDC047821 TaxID=3365488 RepID=UPI00371E4705